MAEPGKHFVQTKTSIQIFVGTLFIINKKWKQPTCSLINEWIKEMWSID